jgi:hypothetical protein
LVLSLSIMSLLVLVILSLAGFLSIESRIAASHQAAVQGRLAALGALRLAVGHLQAEAGPDRRVTARADLTADATQPGWNWNTIRNPLWTGVWRADQPDQPPAWLVSGRHDQTAGSQSTSLAGLADYPSSHWLPWQATAEYSASSAGALAIPLVGDGSATGAELATAADPGKPDGRITLPRVASPDLSSGFGYAYWVGDEGIKARANLNDARLADTAGSLEKRLTARGPARSGMEVIRGFEGTTPGPAFTQVARVADIALLPGFDTTAAGPGLVRRSLHDLSLWSDGLLTDSLWGGLKVDLSQVFEMGDAEFLASEYGMGAGIATLQRLHGRRTEFAEVKMPQWIRQDIGEGQLAPIYSLQDDPDLAPRANAVIRGPSWMILRDHHRLYKQLTWEAVAGKPTEPPRPHLRARAHWPNTVDSSFFYGTRHYSHVYNRMDTSWDAFAFDRIQVLAQKPLKVGATPYVARQVMVLGLQQAEGRLRLVLSPITVLHNPYNVAMRLSPEVATETAAMRVSFRYWHQWVIRASLPSVGSWDTNLLNLARALDGGANEGESFRCYIPAGTVLQPGEFRTFSAAEAQPIPFQRLGNMTNSFDQLGGFWMPLNGPSGQVAPAITDSLSIAYINSGNFYIRHLLSCWPGDRITDPFTGNDGLYNLCSEVTELLANGINNDRHGFAPPKVFPEGFITTLAGPGQPPSIFAVFDYSMRWPNDPGPFPVFTQSNPTALMTRPEATGHAVNPSHGTGYATTSPSFRMTVRSANTWTEVFEPGDMESAFALGGRSNFSGLGGRTSAVVSELPLQAPTSLAQYAHANLGMRDQDPLYTVGSGLAPLFLPLDKVVNYRASENWTSVDRNHLLNAALWDRFFLSSAAPEPNTGAAYSEKRTLAKVLEDLAAGLGTLNNPRMRVWGGRNTSTTAGVTALSTALKDRRRIAGHLVNEGAFNVNSTSVDAWAAVLASTKRTHVANLGPEAPSSTRNARYPRAVRADSATSAPRAPWTSAESWEGFASLDDAQLRLLARAIVDENRFRTQFRVRTEDDRELNKASALGSRRFRGATAGTSIAVPTPYLGMSQFVNRFLDPGSSSQGNAVQKAGALQAAIARADADGAEIAVRSGEATRFGAGQLGPSQGPGQNTYAEPSYREAIEVVDAGNRAGLAAKSPSNQGHAGAFAPGNVLQHDILAAIGAGLSARSDTFVIRAYGDTRAPGGEVRGRAWVEAVVQRTPDFCNATQAPETAFEALTASNKALGRRFRIVAFRWLSPHEI